MRRYASLIALGCFVLALVTGAVGVFAQAEGLQGWGAVMWEQGSGGLPGVPNHLEGSFGGPGTPGDRLGEAVGRGDFNGDGFEDLAIGIAHDDALYTSLSSDFDGVFYGRGAVQVLYGSPSGLGNAGNLLIRATDVLPNEERAAFGSAIASGDINHDGFDDLLVGAPHFGSAAATDEGKGAVVLFWGSASGLVTGIAGSIYPDEPRLITRIGNGLAASGDQFGTAIAVADFDANGYADVAVGMPGITTDLPGADIANNHGAVILYYYGNVGLLRTEYFDQNSPDVEGGVEEQDQFGAALAAGNFDGYGPPDLAIGIPGEDVDTGAVAVFYAETGYGVDPYFRYGDQYIDQNATLDDAVPGGAEEGDRFGASLAAGDLNGNGADDLVIGIPGEDVTPDGTTVHDRDAGAVMVLYGQRYDAGVAGSGHLTAVGAQTFDGWLLNAFLGAAVSVGDFNGDGLGDVAAGAPGVLTNHVTVWYGSRVEHFDPAAHPLGWRSEQWTQDSEGIEGFTEEQDSFGAALVAGDFNGDGADELVVGSPGEDLHTGAAHVLPGLHFDGSGPEIVPTVTGTLVGGWYTSDVTVSFAVTDPQSVASTSGCGTQVIATDGTHNVTCTATSAGGTSSRSVVIKRDTTPPTLQWLGPSPAASSFGWHRTQPSFNYTVADAGAGPVVASGVVQVPGEGANLTRSITVADRAGHTATFVTPAVHVDGTAPQISLVADPPPNYDHWNFTPVRITATCTDGLSGIDSCPAPELFNEEGVLNLPFTATDKAGNTITATHVVGIDRTPPVVTTQPLNTPTASGWYRSLTVRFVGEDAISGVGAPILRNVVVPSGAVQTVSETYYDLAGNATTASFGPVKVDGVPPTVVMVGPAFLPPPNANGWHSAPLSIPFAVSDPWSGVASATPSPLVLNTSSATPVSGVVNATDHAGNAVTVTSGSFKIDVTAPEVTATLSGGASYGIGEPATLTYACSDPHSGIASCSAVVPSGGSIDTSLPGVHTVTVTATNLAGLSRAVPLTYVVSSDQCVASPAHVQSWWTGDANLQDLVGTRHLAQSGVTAVTHVPGRVASAFHFTTTSHLVEPGATPLAFDGASALSFALWVRPAAGGGTLFSRRGDLSLSVDVSGSVRVSLEGVSRQTTAQLPFNQWSHVALVLTRDIAAGGILYVNGVSAATFSNNTSVLPPVPAPLLPRPFRLGAVDTVSLSLDGPTLVVTGFNGDLDEVAVFPRTLTPAEVTGMFLAGGYGMCKEVPPAVAVAAAAGEVGDEVTFEARRYTGVTPFANRTIEFLVDGVVVGSAVTDAEGVATLTVALTGFAAGPHAVTARDVEGGAESEPTTVAITPADGPPMIEAHANESAEATSAAGAVVTYASPATFDVVDGTGTASCLPVSGSWFAIGTSPVTCTATDTAGNHATSIFSVTVVDTTAPAVTVPGDMTVEATNAIGAVVSFAASATDATSTVVTHCSPSSGSHFGLGRSMVTCMAADGHGNVGLARFHVTVADRAGPVLSGVLDPGVVQATGPDGAVVNYGTVVAHDAINGPVPVTCSRPSGATFPLGLTQVDCEATDQSGNTRGVAILILVVDTLAPAMGNVPAAITVEGNTLGGASVSYAVPVATDLVSGSTTVACSPASGTLFPVATTPVSCTSVDAAGNTVQAGFTVTVLDRTPPNLAGVVEPATAQATGPNGAIVNYSTPVAHDVVSGVVPVICSIPSGSVFPIGMTIVNCDTRDLAGNGRGVAMFITVVDTVAPVVAFSGNAGTYTANQTVTINCAATDSGSGVASTTCVNISRLASTFAIGTNTITATATDGAGNVGQASTTFTVTAVAPPAPGLPPIVKQLLLRAGVSPAFIAKLEAIIAAPTRQARKALVKAFIDEIRSKTGRQISPLHAALLLKLAQEID